MKKLQSFSGSALAPKEANNVKGGLNIFCEIYIGRQEAKGEAVDQFVLKTLMVWDDGLNKARAKYA
jgi:hypothetical protein